MFLYDLHFLLMFLLPKVPVGLHTLLHIFNESVARGIRGHLAFQR